MRARLSLLLLWTCLLVDAITSVGAHSDDIAQNMTRVTTTIGRTLYCVSRLLLFHIWLARGDVGVGGSSFALSWQYAIAIEYVAIRYNNL